MLLLDWLGLVILSVYIELNLRASSFSKTMCMLAKRFIACGEKRRVCFSDPTLLPECSHHYVCMYKKNFLSYDVILNKYTAVYLCISYLVFTYKQCALTFVITTYSPLGPTQVKCQLLFSSIFDAMNFQHTWFGTSSYKKVYYLCI